MTGKEYSLHLSHETPENGVAATRSEAERSLAAILETLEDRKAEDIVVIPLAGKSSIADHMIVASGRSGRQVVALADHVLRTVKEKHLASARVEGLPQGDWVLIDAGDVIVHLFRPEVRSFYNLEKLWSGDDDAAPLTH